MIYQLTEMKLDFDDYDIFSQNSLLKNIWSFVWR